MISEYGFLPKKNVFKKCFDRNSFEFSPKNRTYKKKKMKTKIINIAFNI